MPVSNPTIQPFVALRWQVFWSVVFRFWFQCPTPKKRRSLTFRNEERLKRFVGWLQSVSAIASAVLLGPAILVQITTGILHAATGNRTVAKVGVLTTMLPVSPLVLLGLPFGLWARII